jgi:predicted lipid-binding transport protein (Tim44 family)
MQDLIQRIVQNVGIDQDTATSALGIILNFLNKEGPQDKVAALMDMLPGARAIMADQEGGGGGLMGMMGGLMGGGAGGLMAVMGQLTSAGVGMGDVQSVTQEIIGYAKEKAGPEAVNEVLSQIPGLGQFIR